MLSLRSEVFPDFFKKKIDYSKNVAFIGSCFTENIGQQLLETKIPCIINPFGILYNPKSVSNALKHILNKRYFTKDELVFFNEKWISFSHHGIYSGMDKDEVLFKINSVIDRGNQFLKVTNILFITFGTAWVYFYKQTGKIVANCHKMPSKEFEHQLLQPHAIIEDYNLLLAKLKEFNKNLEIVFTISPVRHWKDGAVNNQLSKSNLFVAVHELVKKYDFVHYFPSYEIMMDDLRDYRFYADDMFHPSKLAIDYIWEKFSQTFLSEKAIKISKQVEKLKKNMEHRVFYPKTEAYKKFIISNLKLIKSLKINLPNLNFEKELNHFHNEGNKYWPKEF